MIHAWHCNCNKCKPVTPQPEARMYFMIGDSLILGAKSWMSACEQASAIAGRAVDKSEVTLIG